MRKKTGETVLAQGIVIALRLVMVPSRGFLRRNSDGGGYGDFQRVLKSAGSSLASQDHYLEGFLDVPKLSKKRTLKRVLRSA